MKKTLLALACALSFNSFAEDLSGLVTKVYDGDTLTAKVNESVVKCRLKGIDAPELKQAYGPEARRFLSAIVLNHNVSIRVYGTDLYQRSVCEIFFKDVNVNQLMVASGRAWWYVAFDKKDTEMQKAEQSAKDQKLGIWSTNDNIPPWDWRKIRKTQGK